MDSKLEAVIEKVKKLLALSTSSNANEAAAAASAANRLIDQFRLSELDIATDTSEVDPMVEDNGYIYETGRVSQWKAELVRVLAKHYGCAHYNDINRVNGRKQSRFKLVGRTSDIQIVRYMFSWLSLECQRLADIEAKGKSNAVVIGDDGNAEFIEGGGRVFVESYKEGFVAGIRSQLEISRAQCKKEASSQAIIKLDNRFEESRAFMYSMHNLTRSRATSSRQVHAGAFASGKSRGASMHLGSALGSGKTKLLGSG